MNDEDDIDRSQEKCAAKFICDCAAHRWRNKIQKMQGEKAQAESMITADRLLHAIRMG